MTAAITNQNSPVRSIPLPKSKLLLVADSPERLKQMKTGISLNGFEITAVCSVDELRSACKSNHDLAVIDVEAMQLKPMLSALRTSASHKTIMALVETSRLSEDQGLAGVLPTFRAMPCNQTQMTELMNLFREDRQRVGDRKPVLL
ncbi:MAG: hypothetical protein JST85_14770 [Acidobacteria bacterium]|nr:hypothetical protein [Acidobacteriota bacterium]